MALGNNSKNESVGVVGGGIMGIAAAMELAKSGEREVTLFEKETELGGLSSCFRWNGIVWDRYYHVVLSTDRHLLEFLAELGLEKEVFWKETKTGFYGDRQLVSLSSTTDFIRFPFMSLWQKFRMGLGILYSKSIRNPQKLDKVYVRDWLCRVFGQQVYERIWEPLLRSKLGDAREHTSAAFIWATINRLYGARDKSSNVETMGHVSGGYQRILERAEEYLLGKGVRLCKGMPVEHLYPDRSNGSIKIAATNREFDFDKVILTTPCPSILSYLGKVEEHPYWSMLRNINYLGVACVVVVLTRSLSPYYVINLLESELPFTGVIEVTNVISPAEVGGYHLVYLPKYMPAGDAMMELDDEEMTRQFVDGLRQVFPELGTEDIVHTLVFREPHVQALQGLGSLKRNLSFRTPVENLFVVNTAMIINSTLNNNAVIGVARRVVGEIAS